MALARRNAQPENRDTVRINNNIRITPVRVVSEDGEQLGVLPTEEALERARDAGLDLVEVAPNERPPVCRIMDYGKYKYDKNKKKNKDIRTRRPKKFDCVPRPARKISAPRSAKPKSSCKHKDKVQVSVLFRGREMAHIEEGRKVMESVIEVLSELGKVETDTATTRSTHDLHDLAKVERRAFSLEQGARTTAIHELVYGDLFDAGKRFANLPRHPLHQLSLQFQLSPHDCS